MNEIHLDSSIHQLQESVQHGAQRASDKASEIYQSAALKAGDTLATSKDFVRRNPVPVVLGAFVIGVTIGCMILRGRHKPTFGERFADEPLGSVREAILSALAPVSQRVHDGYDSARDGVENVLDRLSHFKPGRATSSLSDRIGRVGSNLKFW